MKLIGGRQRNWFWGTLNYYTCIINKLGEEEWGQSTHLNERDSCEVQVENAVYVPQVSVRYEHLLIQQCCFLQQRCGNGVLLALPAEEYSRHCAWRPLSGRVPRRPAVCFTARSVCHPRHSSVGRSPMRQRFVAPAGCFSSINGNGVLLTAALLKQSVWLINIQD